MMNIEIKENDQNQRLDRFLKKYFPCAGLGQIYKMIRKDIKVNGKRGKIQQILKKGDVLTVYLSSEVLETFRKKNRRYTGKKQFTVAYEDEDMIVVNKPFGLLTHGDGKEKRETLTNQVIGYLMGTGSYLPHREQTFVPAPVNRLDRNTTGLVVFGKNPQALRGLNQIIKDRKQIKKKYRTIVLGQMKEEREIHHKMEKDSRRNRVRIVGPDEEGKAMAMIAKPLKVGTRYTVVEVTLITGRSHQIRVQLAAIGHPLIGDSKYGNRSANERLKRDYGLTTHLLHAEELEFIKEKEETLFIKSPLPDHFIRLEQALTEKE